MTGKRDHDHDHATGGADPNELLDGSGTNTDSDHTTAGGDDDQFQA